MNGSEGCGVPSELTPGHSESERSSGSSIYPTSCRILASLTNSLTIRLSLVPLVAPCADCCSCIFPPRLKGGGAQRVMMFLSNSVARTCICGGCKGDKKEVSRFTSRSSDNQAITPETPPSSAEMRRIRISCIAGECI